MLPLRRFAGGGPAGVVDGLPKSKPDGAGVVEPAGAVVVVSPVEAPPKYPLDSPGPKRDPSEGFGGVCEPPKPAKDGMLPPKPPKAAAGLFSAVAPVDDFFSPALDVPGAEKFHPVLNDWLASELPKVPAPNRPLPTGFAFPRRLGVDDELVEGVAPNIDLGGLLAIAAVGTAGYDQYCFV